MTTTLVPLPPFPPSPTSPTSPMPSPRSSPLTFPSSPGREGKPSFRKRVSSFITGHSRRRSSSSPNHSKEGSPEPNVSPTHSSKASSDSGIGTSPPTTVRSSKSSPYLSPNQLPHEQPNGSAANGQLKLDPALLAPSLVRTSHLSPSPIAESPAREAAATAGSPRVASPRTRVSPYALSSDAHVEQQVSPYVVTGLEPNIEEELEEPKVARPAAAVASGSTASEPSNAKKAQSSIAQPTAATTPSSPFSVPALAASQPLMKDTPHSPHGLGLDLQQSPLPSISVLSEDLVASPPEIPEPLSEDSAARAIQHAWRSHAHPLPPPRLTADRPTMSRAGSLHPGVIIVGVPDDAASSVGDYDRDDEESSVVEVDYVRVLPDEVEKPQSPLSANGRVSDEVVQPVRPRPVRRLTNGVPSWVEEAAAASPVLPEPLDSVFISSPEVSPVIEKSYLPPHTLVTAVVDPVPSSSPEASTLQRMWSATCGVAERAFAAIPVSVPVLGVLAPSAEGISTTDISRPSTPLPPAPTPPLQGWTTYVLPDGREYYYHAALRSTSDVWPVPLPLPPPPGLELHIHRDGEQWVDHGNRAVWKGSPDSVDMSERSEVAYWAYVASHPVHVTLPTSAVQEATDMLTWSQADPVFTGTRFSTPFTRSEAAKLSSLLRDAQGSMRNHLTARILHRRASLRSSMRVRARFRQTLPPLSLRFLFGALFVGLPLLMRSRTRSGRLAPGALAFVVSAWPKPGEILPRIYSFAASTVSGQ